MATKTFKEVEAWKKAHENVLSIYRITENFPKNEIFGLTSQFRRAAVSVAANIAEGYKKKSNSDKLRFYNISQGSLEECRYYTLLSKDLKYINEIIFTTLDNDIELCDKLLSNYCKAISKNNGFLKSITIFFSTLFSATLFSTPLFSTTLFTTTLFSTPLFTTTK
jgi:four helix bundle protein